MRPIRAAMALVLCLLLHASVSDAQTIQVTPLTRGDRVLVSFTLSNVFTEEVRRAIHSGLTITFSYDVQLRRGAALWLDRTIEASSVSATVKYDPVTREYLVTRKTIMQPFEAYFLTNEEAVRKWLTEFEKLPFFSSKSLEANAEYYVRVRARTSPRNAAFVWPWGSDVAGLAKFTFLK
jgi:hypothetical protein